MKRYVVTWEIDIDAESAEDAARQALAIQRDPNSLATIFDCVHVEETEDGNIDVLACDTERIDVTALDEERVHP